MTGCPARGHGSPFDLRDTRGFRRHRQVVPVPAGTPRQASGAVAAMTALRIVIPDGRAVSASHQDRVKGSEPS